MTPNQEQQAVIAATAPRTTVIAGPGSGKTATLVARLQAKAATEPPQRTAVVTFTVKAADEMRTRLGDAAAKYYHIGTLHSLGIRILERSGRYQPGVTVIDEEQSDKLLAAAADQLKLRKTAKALREMVTKPPRPGSEAAMLTKVFRRCLRSLNATDYDTILSETLDALGEIGYVAPFDHLYVDELQDSAGIDMAIYEAMPVATRFYVGDPDQAIYAFRGGDIGNILTAASAVGVYAPTLETNYRSRPEICKIADTLIRHNTLRSTKGMGPVLPPGGQVTVRAFATSVAEANAIADSCRELIEAGTSPGEIAVLCRYNRHAAGLASFIAASGLPVRAAPKVRGAEEITKATQAANAMLGGSPVAWAMAQGKIEPADVIKGTRVDPAMLQGIAETIEDWPADPQGLYRSLRIMGVGDRPARAFTSLATRPDGGVDLLRGVAEAHAMRTSGREGTGDGISIITMHAAKGLEWDVVFLAAAEQEILPAKAQGAELEEMRRLMFVAMTRARHGLHISSSEQRPGWKPGSTEVHTPTQFLAEAGLLTPKALA